MKQTRDQIKASMRARWAGVWTVLCVVGCSSCAPDVPLVSLGIDPVYYLPRMTPYTLTPALTGDSYRWTVKTESGGDSLLSTAREFLFLESREGTYELTFELVAAGLTTSHSFRVVVVHEDTEFSASLSKVYEYRPAPGQFVNELPLYEPGDTEEDMRRKAEESLVNGTLISLGAYGGYVTFGFDHTIVNVSGKKDFKILGNALYESGSSSGGGGAEPGVVMVAFDANRNGRPDPEEWYELAGSAHYNPATVSGYEVSYRRPDPDKKPVPGGLGVVDAEYIAWTDNRGENGYVTRNTYHKQAYYPQWLDQEVLTCTGTLLPPNAENPDGKGAEYILHAYAWGYADNHPNKHTDLISFDIDWAVDSEGNPVSLPGVDFIRVYTGVNQSCGWLGETSTEISQAQDLHLEAGSSAVAD